MRISWLFLLTAGAALLVMGGAIWYFILLVRMTERFLRAKEKREARADELRRTGEVLRRHREACGMTETSVGEKLGVDAKTVSRWESGADDPGDDNVKALAALFGVTRQELIYEAWELWEPENK